MADSYILGLRDYYRKRADFYETAAFQWTGRGDEAARRVRKEMTDEGVDTVLIDRHAAEIERCYAQIAKRYAELNSLFEDLHAVATRAYRTAEAAAERSPRQGYVGKRFRVDA